MDLLETDAVIKSLTKKANIMPIQVFILIWTLADMYNKKQDFQTIVYPFSPIGLFTEEEAAILDKNWVNVPFPDSLDEPTYLFESIDSTFFTSNLICETIEMNYQESALPFDFTPSKSITPFIVCFLEAIRLRDKKDQSIYMLISSCIDVTRGDTFQTINNALNFIKTDANYFKNLLTAIRDSILICPSNIRTPLQPLLSKSPKDLFLGFSTWLFVVMSPQFIRDTVSTQSVNSLYEISKAPSDEYLDVPPLRLFADTLKTHTISTIPVTIIRRNATLKQKRCQ
jgi:hypothetical protein